LLQANQSLDQIYALDGDWQGFSRSEQSLFNLVKNLDSLPVVLSAANVQFAIDQVGPRDFVKVISFTTAMASFNRITEAVGLPLDKSIGDSH